jgi:hypothetical protein
MGVLPPSFSAGETSLVPGLVEARDDPAKKRIRARLMDLDDLQLSGLDLTSVDIATLRGCPRLSHAFAASGGAQRDRQ